MTSNYDERLQKGNTDLSQEAWRLGGGLTSGGNRILNCKAWRRSHDFGMRFLFCLIYSCALLWPTSTWGGTLAQFRTPLGDIEVELYDVSKPATVQNFIRYVKAGAYQDMFMHRWEPGFVIQGGGFRTSNRHETNAALEAILTFPAVTNEYGVGRVYSNLYGTIAMARASGQTNSATSQWFFNLTNNAALDKVDGGFTVFGRVLRGANVLNRFNLTSSENGIYWTDAGAPLNRLPVLSTEPEYKDLVYVDVSLINVQVELGAVGHPEISWDSVSNTLNRVEFTTRMPPLWTELVSTNGNGSRLQVTDTAPDSVSRFYRVRVDY